MLIAGRGHDTLTGGQGADIFVLADTPGRSNSAYITDFTSGVDTIRLDHASYASLPAGLLAADALLVLGPGSAAATAATRLVYDTSNGSLAWDADGSGAGVSVQLAVWMTTPHFALTAGDFEVA